jgi:hypothetical protein
MLMWTAERGIGQVATLRLVHSPFEVIHGFHRIKIICQDLNSVDDPPIKRRGQQTLALVERGNCCKA